MSVGYQLHKKQLGHLPLISVQWICVPINSCFTETLCKLMLSHVALNSGKGPSCLTIKILSLAVSILSKSSANISGVHILEW